MMDVSLVTGGVVLMTTATLKLSLKFEEMEALPFDGYTPCVLQDDGLKGFSVIALVLGLPKAVHISIGQGSSPRTRCIRACCLCNGRPYLMLFPALLFVLAALASVAVVCCDCCSLSLLLSSPFSFVRVPPVCMYICTRRSVFF